MYYLDQNYFNEILRNMIASEMIYHLVNSVC